MADTMVPDSSAKCPFVAWHRGVDVHFSRSETPENPSRSSSGHNLHTPFKDLHPSSFLVTPNIPVLEIQAFLLSKTIKGSDKNVFKRNLSELTSVSCFLQTRVLSLKQFNCFYNTFFLLKKTFSHITDYSILSVYFLILV